MLNVLLILLMIVMTATMPGPVWVSHTVSFWLSSVWFFTFATITYINKFYKVSVTGLGSGSLM